MKTVLITGASQGVGKSLALKFVQEGHRVVAVARNMESLQSLKEQCEGETGEVHIVARAIEDFRSADLPQGSTPIDILIHNAGHLVAKPFLETTAEELHSVYQTNIIAPFQMTQELFPHLQTEAHVISISSVGGVTGSVKFPGLTAYSSSKAAISCLTEVWQAEFADSGMTFNSLALGSVQTEMLEKAFPGLKAAATPEQMADYIYNFALEAPSVIKGKTISVSSSNP